MKTCTSEKTALRRHKVRLQVTGRRADEENRMFDLLLMVLVVVSFAFARGYADLCGRVLSPFTGRSAAS
jgi:hypothetical protein